MTQITRRDFSTVALGTVPTSAIDGVLVGPWPPADKVRPVGDPQIVRREHGYLMDPDWDEAQWPTLRQARGYDDLDREGKIEFFIDSYVDDEDTLAEEYGIERPPGGWRQRQLADLEALFGERLDEPLDWDSTSFHEALVYGPYWVGELILDALSDEERRELGVYLVEGEHPGSSFCGVRCDGELSALNAALARHGVNIVVLEGDV